jgi:hypothetical protein
VARAKVAKVAESVKRIAARRAKQPTTVTASKPDAPKQVAETAKPAQKPEKAATAAVSVRRSLYGVAFAPNLSSKPALQAKPQGLPAVVRTTSVVSSAPKAAKPVVEPTKTASAAQPAPSTGTAWYQQPKQVGSADDSSSLIRPVSFETQPTMERQSEVEDGSKLSVRVAKRGAFRAAKDRQSRVARYLAEIEK